MSPDTRFALFAVLHESDSGTLETCCDVGHSVAIGGVNRTCRGQLISVANDPYAAYAPRPVLGELGLKNGSLDKSAKSELG